MKTQRHPRYPVKVLLSYGRTQASRSSAMWQWWAFSRQGPCLCLGSELVVVHLAFPGTKENSFVNPARISISDHIFLGPRTMWPWMPAASPRATFKEHFLYVLYHPQWASSTVISFQVKTKVKFKDLIVGSLKEFMGSCQVFPYIGPRPLLRREHML